LVSCNGMMKSLTKKKDFQFFFKKCKTLFSDSPFFFDQFFMMSQRCGCVMQKNLGTVQQWDNQTLKKSMASMFKCLVRLFRSQIFALTLNVKYSPAISIEIAESMVPPLLTRKFSTTLANLQKTEYSNKQL
jgi:hypothetical protein